MFIGDFEKPVPWSENGVKGCRRFLERVWNLQTIIVDEDNYSEKLVTEIHKTIKKVTEDYENLKANTAIAQLMSLSNEFNDAGKITKEDFRTFLILLNPVAPHITEELWQICDLGGILSEQEWPIFDEKLTVDDEIEIPVQFNGKVRFTINISRDSNQDEVFEILEKDELYAKNIETKKVVKKIYVPNKIVNIVVK